MCVNVKLMHTFFNHVSLEVHGHNNIIILQNKLQVDVGMIQCSPQYTLSA